jgi:hypothetical protein
MFDTEPFQIRLVLLQSANGFITFHSNSIAQLSGYTKFQRSGYNAGGHFLYQKAIRPIARPGQCRDR